MDRALARASLWNRLIHLLGFLSKGFRIPIAPSIEAAGVGLIPKVVLDQGSAPRHSGQDLEIQ